MANEAAADPRDPDRMARQVISILLPTRNRRERFEETLLSILKTISTGDAAEVLVYVSDCDHSYDHFASTEFCKFIRGPRLVMSDLWNALIPHAKGDIFMLCADDVIFRTGNWDLEIEKAFAAVPDKILLAFANDGGPNGKTFAALPFVSRRWVEIVGYFTGPGFSADYSDTWPNDVADMIGRKKYVDVLIEHLHHVWGKAPEDQTYRENQERWMRDRPDLQYAKRSPERIADTEKLRKAMQ